MKNILICVTGLTPQIVTETLFCLTKQQKKVIDELYIVTTTRGRNVILGVDEKTKLSPLKVELKRLCDKYKINNPKFEYNDTHIIVANDLSIELDDIRNDKDNRLFPNKLCEFINDKTSSKENTLYCSISGGRKSMSVDMAFALSLFGRENDKLLHVLTHENQEFKGFFPETKAQEKELELAELPYVKLRSIIAKETKNKNFGSMKYTDIVDETQRRLKIAFGNKLIINTITNELIYDENNPVKLEPAEMKLYKFIAEMKKEGSESVSVDDILHKCPHKFSKSGYLPKINHINKKIEKAISDIEILSRLVILTPKNLGNSNYGILLDGSKIKIKE